MKKNFIIVNSSDGIAYRLNVDHIVAYGRMPGADSTTIVMTVGTPIDVQENEARISDLIKASSWQ